MIVRVANCPGCGGEVRFDVRSSMVAVCPTCRTVVGRSGANIEDLGKVAELAETNSPLELGVTGRYGLSFTLTGRVQYKHPTGAVWDEWYATFTDGRVGWLAEAQGRFFMTFQKSLGQTWPRFEDLQVGQLVPGLPISGALVVAEKNRAHSLAAEGEIPFRVQAGQEYDFADLSGEHGEFGTLDYRTDPPLFYFGRQVTLAEIGLKTLELQQAAKVSAAQGAQVACPKCGGGLELRAPDQTERVGCPYCGALLDCQKGNLSFLKALKPPKHKPVLPLGAAGAFEGVPQTVIAFLVRSTVLEGTTYNWEEYLLYHPKTGYRWLVRSDDHWTYARGIPPGDVKVDGRSARYEGRAYSQYQDSTARVEHVVGEVFWKVAAGEEVRATDYSRPPEMLSREISLDSAGNEGEVNWSHATYVQPSEIELKFGLKDKLPRPTEEHPCVSDTTNVTKSMLGCLGICIICIVLFVIIAALEDDSGSSSGSSAGRGSFHTGGGK